MVELKLKFKTKKTVWFYLLWITQPLGKLRFCKFLEGKPLVNLYLGDKFQGSVKFKLSDFT